MYDETNHNSYGSRLTSVTEVHTRVVYILDNIFHQWLCAIPCVHDYFMQLPNTKAVSGNVSPLLLLILVYTYIGKL